jgi:hypothetical protein
MTIGVFATGIGNQNVTQLNTDFKEFIPTGQLDDVKGNSFHLPFSKQEVKYDNKLRKPVIPEIAGHYHDFYYDNQPLTQKNPTISVFTDLYNFNPTHKEIGYYHPHETEKLFHKPESRPRFEREFTKDTSIADKIEKIRKWDAPVTLPQHSFSIKRRVRT